MFKTIFGKHITLYFSIMIISFIFIGTSISQFFKSYYMDNQEKLLLEQGEKLSQRLIQNLYLKLDGTFLMEIDDTSVQIIEILETYLDSELIISDDRFNILYNSAVPVEKAAIDLNMVPQLKKVMSGEHIALVGTLGGVYKESKFIVGYPVIFKGKTMAVIFMSSSMESIKENISEVARITSSCVFISGFFAFIMIYASSKSISRPLQQMNNAAKVIANGDFEKRIEIESIDEVGQLAKTFNEMAKSLEEQEKTRREFIANISHDLRSPLTSIIGFLQAIKDGTIPYEKQERYIKIILDECTRLSKLANDLLDISKIQVIGDVSLMREEFDINEAIRNVLVQFENRIMEKGISLEVAFANETDIVLADYDKIKRVIYNLVDNAVKFTPNGGIIKTETFVKDSKVYVSIKDNGKGIAEEERKRIFERFYKADPSRGRDKTGSGLGLAIVNEFVKAHGEKIHVRSEKNQGSEFIFTLKMADKEVKKEKK